MSLGVFAWGVTLVPVGRFFRGSPVGGWRLRTLRLVAGPCCRLEGRVVGSADTLMKPWWHLVAPDPLGEASMLLVRTVAVIARADCQWSAATGRHS
jgi:hypothetical protein